MSCPADDAEQTIEDVGLELGKLAKIIGYTVIIKSK